jgi:hypothetical protein
LRLAHKASVFGQRDAGRLHSIVTRTVATNNPFDPAALADGTSTLTMRDSALGLSTDLVQAGVVFNDATRLLDGGLWSKPGDANNQQNYTSM